MPTPTIEQLITLDDVARAIELAERAALIQSPDVRSAIEHAIAGILNPPLFVSVERSLLDLDAIDPAAVKQALTKLDQTAPAFRAFAEKHHTPKRHQSHSVTSQAARVQQWLEVHFTNGATVADMHDIVDEDLRVGLANTLSYLRRANRIKGVRTHAQDNAGVERPLWRYYPLASTENGR